LREITVQYTSCADPTESLARKQRVLHGEARGLMAEIAEQIIATSSRQILSAENLSLDHHPAPASGQIEETFPVCQQVEGTTLEPTVLKKKRGRPPLTKPVNKSPIQLTSAKSSKRNKVLIQNSPRRRSAPSRIETQTLTKRKPPKQRLTLVDEEAGPSTSRAPN